MVALRPMTAADLPAVQPLLEQTLRRSGVGAALMDAAERWAQARGLGSVALSSNVVRHDAHAFYAKRGYQVTATSHRFRKTF